MDIEAILATASQQGASDIHLVSGEQPIIRVDTGLITLEQSVLEPEEMEKLLSTMLNEKQLVTLEEQQDVDLSWAPQECRLHSHRFQMVR